VTGLGYKPELSDFQARFVHSDLGERTSMTIMGDSDRDAQGAGLLNQLASNVRWSALSNVMSVPTDCPSRDERRGWMGDAALAAELMQFRFFSGPFHARFLRAIAAAQTPEGGVPAVVPGSGNSPDPSWSTAFPTIAYELIRHEGDLATVRAVYPQLRKYMNWLARMHSETGLRRLFARFADWCPPGGLGRYGCASKANPHLVSAGTYLRDLQSMAHVATHLGEHPDAAGWLALRAALVNEFNREFYRAPVNSDAAHAPAIPPPMYGGQTGMAMALWLGIAENATAVTEALVTDLMETHGGHLDTGVIGTRYIFEALTKHGRFDVALAVVLGTTFPSFGYSIVNNMEPATSIWEIWDAATGRDVMDSRNHVMFATVDTWIYKYVAGLGPAEDAVEFDKLVFRPEAALLPRRAPLPPGATLANQAGGTAAGAAGAILSASIVVRTRHGHASLEWNVTDEAPAGSGAGERGGRRGRLVHMAVVVPAGSTAVVHVPDVTAFTTAGAASALGGLRVEESGAVIWCSGSYVSGVTGVLGGALSSNGRSIEFAVLPGTYQFWGGAESAAFKRG
jgi:hypothetical protein